MKKYKNKKIKFIAFLFAFVCLFSTFVVSSYAWSEDVEGNLISDNLQPIQDKSSSSIGGVTFSINEQKLFLNGTSTSGSWQNITTNSFTLNAGTYTIQWFTNYNGNNIGFGAYNNSSSLSNLYQLNTNRYKTFTLTQDTTFTIVVWWQSSGIILDNIYVQSMIYEGSYKAYTMFEPYGKIYYNSNTYSPTSKLYYGNLSNAYMSYYINGGVDLCTLGFVYDGVLGYADGINVSPQWNSFITEPSYYNMIVSPYGMFYHTTWDIYNFIQEESSYPSFYQDKPFTLVYEFSLPQDFNDSYFELVGFNSINFYDINGVLLYNNTSSTSFNVDLYGVSSIECILNNAGDIADEELYLIADVFAGYYNLGYQKGYASGSSLKDTFYNNGYELGYKQGMDDYLHGIYTNSNSYNYGYEQGYQSGSGNSYNTGFAAGYAKARADTTWIDNSTANATDLFWTIGSTPWESFKNIWNINFLGINLANVVTGFVTALIVIWLIKKVWK